MEGVCWWRAGLMEEEEEGRVSHGGDYYLHVYDAKIVGFIETRTRGKVGDRWLDHREF